MVFLEKKDSINLHYYFIRNGHLRPKIPTMQKWQNVVNWIKKKRNENKLKTEQKCFYLKFNKPNVLLRCEEKKKKKKIDENWMRSIVFVLFCFEPSLSIVWEIIKDSRGFYMTHYGVTLQNATHCLYSNSIYFYCVCVCLFCVCCQ